MQKKKSFHRVVKIYGGSVEATMCIKWCTKLGEELENVRLAQGRRHTPHLKADAGSPIQPHDVLDLLRV